MGVFKFILFIGIILLSHQQDPDDRYENMGWEVLLNDVRTRYRYDSSYNAFVPIPRFGREVRALEGTEVSLKGFFLPADVSGNVIVLSYMPMAMCFFCAGAGIESVVEIHSKPLQKNRFRRLRTDDFIEIRGKLKLNPDNLEHLIYILEDTELIKVYR
jgi:hypothetical protein